MKTVVIVVIRSELILIKQYTESVTNICNDQGHQSNRVYKNNFIKVYKKTIDFTPKTIH